LRCRALGPSYRFLHQLRLEQFYSAVETRELQSRRLEKLLLHAYRTVPYYARTLEQSGVIRDGVVRLGLFGRIPPLERAQIQDRDPQLVSSTANLRSSVWYASGGSTGMPAQVLLDRTTQAWFLAVQMFFDSWTGYHSGERRALLWGSERDLFQGSETFRTHLGRWLRNELILNAFRMDFERMRRYLRMLDEYRPALLVGYADCMFELARLAEREHIPVRGPGAIMSAAGTLYPEMRATLERVFQSPIFDRYGCREVGDVACEDQTHAGLVVCNPTHYVEIIRPNGEPCAPGEPGEVLLTLLVNYSMPIIRYRIGDLGAWASGPTSSVTPWPVLQHIEGRKSDAFLRSDGGVVSPFLFVHIVGVVMNRGWVHKYQIVQEALDDFRILIVPSDGDLQASAHEPEFADIASKLQNAVGLGCRVRFELVPTIEPSPSGKHRWLVCKVPQMTRDLKAFHK
jgi:phenylacetate-CoA ligase